MGLHSLLDDVWIGKVSDLKVSLVVDNDVLQDGVSLTDLQTSVSWIRKLNDSQDSLVFAQGERITYRLVPLEFNNHKVSLMLVQAKVWFLGEDLTYRLMGGFGW